MKKVLKSLLIFLGMILIWSSASFAAALVAKIDIEQDKTEATPGDTVTFTLKLTDVENAEGGVVSAIAGKVEYEDSFYEDLTTSGLTINESTGKFTQTGSFKNDSVIGTISLKVKSDATGSGNVTFSELAANDGKDNIEESEAKTADTTRTVSIREENPTPTETPTPTPEETETPTPTPEETETPTPTPEETETPTPTPEETETPTPTPEETETPTPTPDVTETLTPTPTQTGSTVVIKPTPSDDIKGGTETNTDATEKASNLPKTGSSPIVLIAIVVCIPVIYITYKKVNKYKGI